MKSNPTNATPFERYQEIRAWTWKHTDNGCSDTDSRQWTGFAESKTGGYLRYRFTYSSRSVWES